MSFFETSNSGEFDVVRALIDAIGMAWNALTFPLRMVISVVQAVIGVFNQFRTGQIDLPTFILNIMTLMFTAYQTVFNQIMSFVISIGARLVSAIKSAALRMVNGMISNLRALPGRVYSLLHSVVSKVSSAIQAWINTAKSKVSTLISNITSPFHGVASAISSALSGVVSAIKAPFEAAYNAVKPILDKIKAGMDLINSVGNAFGGEESEGRQSLLIGANDTTSKVTTTPVVTTTPDDHLTVDINNNVTLDLVNVPQHIDTDTLIQGLSDRKVLSALTSNSDFQTLDAKVKERLNLKIARSRGV
jgi:phage-related protein